MSSQKPFRYDSPILSRVVLALALLFVVVFVMRAFFSPQASSPPATSTPAPTATSEFLLTATEIIRQATLTAQPTAAQMTQIVALSRATRTAVAITRHPPPENSPTLAPVEYTATSLVATSQMQSTEWMATSVAETETAVVDPRTPTPFPTLDPDYTFSPAKRVCGVWLVGQSDLHASLEADLQAAGIPTIVVGVPVSGILQKDCSVLPIQTTFDIVVDVSAVQSDLADDALLHDLTERILAVLAEEYPVTEAFGPQRPRLMIDFAGQGIPGRLLPHVDTDYQNALNAYAEGLRGDDLMDALGGMLTYR